MAYNWINAKDYTMLKQKCYVLPKRGLVITQLCEIEDTGNDLRNSMEKWLLGLTTTEV
ncbi:MAG: hypothetical protein K5697_07915 [Lachnospiraceae bacterium]|nr:hypothetical protein [Lachnospiraceae bacterium]